MSYGLFTMIFLMSVSNLFSQISITQNDLLSLIGQTHTFADTTHDTADAVDVGNAGPNQTWDFSNLDLSNSNNNITQYMSPEGTPFVDDFPSANMIQKMEMNIEETFGILYIYLRVEENSFRTLGTGIEAENPDTSFVTSGEEYMATLPLTYESTWTETSVDTFEFFGAMNITEEITDSFVDAWGTITVPAGQFSCLRIRDERTTIIKNMFGGIVLSADTSTGVDYSWVSDETLIIASVSSEEDPFDPEFSQTYISVLAESKTTALGDEIQPAIARTHMLHQNYPNPFNPVTRIAFDIPRSEHVILEVYNTIGQRIQTVLDRPMSTGSHQVEFNAAQLPSGVYYYSIKAGNYHQVKKMILLR
jgi:hypothetical protein